jgi:hypothetical protein
MSILDNKNTINISTKEQEEINLLNRTIEFIKTVGLDIKQINQNMGNLQDLKTSKDKQ